MPADAPTDLAQRLLDAQVAFVVEELTGPAGPALVAGEVRALLDALRDVPVAELVDRDALQATVTAVLDATGPSPAVGALVLTLVPLLHHLPASEDHDLGTVVDRARVEAVVEVLVRSQRLREEVLQRLGASPTVSVLAMRFVTALVEDAVQQNRERAEKVPGVKSLLGVGDFAARQARGLAPRQLEQAVGGAADRSTQAAMQRVRRAFLTAFDEDAVRTAVLEVWDDLAEEPVAALRAHLTDEEVDRLAARGHDVWLDVQSSAWFRAAVAAGVDAFLDLYGQHTLGELLEEFGLDTHLVGVEVERHAGGLLEATRSTGQLEALVRRRLEPFFRSPAARELLAE